MSSSKTEVRVRVPPLVLALSTLFMGCDAQLRHDDGLRYRVRVARKIRVMVFEVQSNGTALEVDNRLHDSPVSVVDETTHMVNLDGAAWASHALTVGFFEDGTLKSLKLSEESEAAETLESVAGQLGKLPDAVEALSRIDRTRDLEQTEDLDAKKRRLEAEKALLDARRALGAEQSLAVQP